MKFKTSTSDSWKWVNDQSHLTNGMLLLQSYELPARLHDCFDEFTYAFTVEATSSEVPETKLWSLTLELPFAGSKSSFSNDLLGVPLDVSRWFALIRIWSPWLAPRHGKNIFSVAEDAVMCSFLRHDGLHLVLLAVSGIDDVLTVFKNDGKGQVIVSSRNDSPDSGQARVLAAVGRTFEKANAACMYHARKLVSGKVSISKDVHNELAKPIDEDMRAQYMENWYDGLTYCTWNGLGQDLNEQKIFDALDDLKQNNIKVTNLIIDDNWQSLDNQGESQFRRGWTDFEANKEGFPRGLRHTVATLRDNHPNIQHVAVWHALLGYWGGVSPTGNIAKKYKTKLVERNSGLPSFISAGNITVIDPDDVQKMYDDFYKFLLDSRVDSVKTDAQFFLDLLSDAEDRRRFTKAYQDAWTISSLRYFSVKSISCMSQTPPIIFHTQLPMDKPHQMVRNSDDFFPEVPTSHPWHVFTNAYNALLNSHLNILPDWDMFQTSHEYSSFHAAGRCISGGPIYFTDEPGKHDIDLINQMTAISVKDKTVILRPDNIGKTISSEVYTAYEDERMLKVGNYHGRKASGTGILAIFNVSLRPLSELVMLGEFPGVEEDVEYIVRAHSTGEVSPPMKKTDKLAIVSLELQTKGWDIISAYPLQSFTSKGTLTKVTNLGLLGKMTGAAAITSLDAHMEGDIRFRMRSSLKALGLLGEHSQLEALMKAD